MADYLTRDEALGIITSTCKHCGRPIEKKIYGNDNEWYHTEGMWAWGHLPFHDPEPDPAELQRIIDYNNFCARKTLNPDK